MKLVVLLFFAFMGHSYSQEITEKNYATFKEFLVEQNNKISSINNGLSKAEVKEIMGDTILVKIPKVGKMKPLSKLFKQPEFINEYKSNPGKEIVILWYFSEPKDQNGMISKSECTPVIFENDSVVGKGWTFINSYRRVKRIRL